ncbi:hypothetical protein RQP46_008568 [Phenoliferia psychrophenolica]
MAPSSPELSRTRRSVSPTPSARSTRSFLDEDPYASSRSAPTSPPTNSLTPDTLLTQLERLLASKASEIQLAGRLGEALLGQQAELEARIREVAEVQSNFAASTNTAHGSPGTSRRAMREASAEKEGVAGGDDTSDGEKEVGAETKKKLAALEEDMKKWDEGNSGLYDVVGTAAARGVPQLLPSHSTTAAASPEIPVSPPRSGSGRPTTAPLSPSADASSSRRARNNAQHRTNDIELATEIGQSLLGEVRRLQSLLAEREETIRDNIQFREALEQELQNELAARRTVEENVDKFKEENWNLEFASQEAQAQLAAATLAVQKGEQERQRIQRELGSTRDALDLAKLDSEKLAGELEQLKQRHETDMANMRKTAAGLQRERSDLQGHLDGLKTQLATNARGIRRVESNKTGDVLLADDDGDDRADESDTDAGQNDDVFREAGARRKTGDGFLPPPSPSDLFDDDSPDNSPVQRPADTAGSSLSHLQRTISTLRASLAREKAAKMDLRRQLAEGPASPDSWAEEEDEPSSREVTPARNMRGSARRGTGGRRRGAQGPSRLGRELTPSVSGDTSIDEGDEEGDDSFAGHDHSNGGAGHDDAGSLFEHNFHAVSGHLAGQLDEDDQSEQGFDSPRASQHRNRGSVDMDPDFANVLDRDSDNDSLRSSGSPGGNQLASLAAALGHRRPNSISSVATGRPASGYYAPPAIVWVDQSTMTDFPLPEPIQLPPIQLPPIQLPPIQLPPPPPPPVSHVGVQATPEPIVPVSTVDFVCQTDPIVPTPTKESFTEMDQPKKLVLVEAGVATDPPASSVSIDVQTDPLPVPTVIPVPLSLAIPHSNLHPTKMEDRALATQPSLELLTPTLAHAAQRSADEDLTFTGLPAATGPTLDSGGETEQETDGEFEDARETIGAASPAPTSAAPSALSFGAVHSTGGIDSDEDESDMEVLRQSPIARRTALRALETSPAKKGLLVEAGVQTDPSARSTTPASLFTRTTRPLTTISDKRDSINTFGRPDSAGFDAAVIAQAYLSRDSSEDQDQERSLSDFRPESAASVLTTQSDAFAPTTPTLDKGKGPAQFPTSTSMPPPPARSISQRKNLSPRKSAASSFISNSTTRTTPPPRPTSPPPADLLYRAQSPTYDNEYDRRANGLLDPSSARSHSPGPSRSLRANTRPTTKGSSTLDAKGRTQNLRPHSSTPRRGASSSGVSISEMSFHSERRASVASSRTSDGGFDSPLRTGGDSTDPQVIHAITQTMIGEFLHKYTKKAFGKGISEKRHKRFFWVHPYTKTLYWSSADPGAANTNQSSAKSVFIEGVRQVIDPNPFPPGLHQGSIIVKTPNREMKITASTRERHDMWFQAINYLLARPDVPAADPNSTDTPGRNGPLAPRTDGVWTTPKGLYHHGSASESHLTPKTAGPGVRTKKLSTPSTYKRSGTAAAEYERAATFGSPRSLRTFADYLAGGDESVEFVDRREIPDELGPDDDETWEGLENVRACCNGKHDVGSLSRHGGRHHHHHGSSSEVDLPNGQAISPTRSRSKGSFNNGSVGSKASTWSRRVASSPRKSTVPLPSSTPLATTTNGAGRPAR